MFGTKADANQARWDAAQEWPALDEFHRPRQRNLLIRAKDAADQSILNEYLHTLRHSRGQFAPPFDTLKMAEGHGASGERLGEDVRGGYGILDCQIDSDAPDWRHRMGGVANA